MDSILQKLYIDRFDKTLKISPSESKTSQISEVNIPQNTTSSTVSRCPKYGSPEDILYPNSALLEHTISNESSQSNIPMQKEVLHTNSSHSEHASCRSEISNDTNQHQTEPSPCLNMPSSRSSLTASFQESDRVTIGSHVTTLDQSAINNRDNDIDIDIEIQPTKAYFANSNKHKEHGEANVVLPNNILEDDFDIADVHVNFNLLGGDENDENIALDDIASKQGQVGSTCNELEQAMASEERGEQWSKGQLAISSGTGMQVIN